MTAVTTPALQGGQSQALQMLVDGQWVDTNYREAHLPFGGRAGKASGLCRVGGRHALEQMTDLKRVIVDTED